MAKALEWRKSWQAVLGEEDKENVSASGGHNSLGLVGVDALSETSKLGRRRRPSASSSVTSSQLVDVEEDDDMLSSISQQRGLDPSPEEAVAAEVMDWLSPHTSDSEPVASASVRLRRELSDGRALVALLQRGRLLPGAGALDTPTARFRAIQDACRSAGLPGRSTLRQGDSDLRRVVSCLMLLSRCCGAGVPALRVSPRRLSALGIARADEMVLGPHVPGRLADAQLKGAFWVPDAFSRSCLLCGEDFGWLTRRRHHCRACGALVCAACSKDRARCLGYRSLQRVCGPCMQERRRASTP